MASVTAAKKLLASLFTPVADYGLYTWRPGSKPQLKSFKEVTVGDIISRLGPSCPATAKGNKQASKEAKGGQQGDVDKTTALLDGLSLRTTPVPGQGPPVLDYSHVRFSLDFRSDLPAQITSNHFPNDPGYITPIFVAVSRGMQLNDIDFVLGGSSLDVLASQHIDKSGNSVTRYLCQRVGNAICVVKSKKYTSNAADQGFQFERLVTGGKLEGKSSSEKHESIHVLQIGPFKVLLSADVDAVDKAGNAVEIKSGNPRYFGTKVIFQMISSGSQTLVFANKRGPTLLGIEEKSLDTMVSELKASLMTDLHRTIVAQLTALKASPLINEEFPTELDFDGSKQLTLTHYELGDIFPAKSVCDQLLQEALALRATGSGNSVAVEANNENKKDDDETNESNDVEEKQEEGRGGGGEKKKSRPRRRRPRKDVTNDRAEN